MLKLIGWSNPGRSISDTTHRQMFGIMSYLKDKDKVGQDVWNSELQAKIGKTIDVNKPSTLRHIVGFMKSIGIIYGDSLQGGKVPDSRHLVTQSGEVLYQLIEMEQLAKEQKKKEVIEQVGTMYKHFYANAFIYWYVRGTDIHVVRTVLKTLDKFDSLDKMEWFIMNTFITATDNAVQEEIVEKYIEQYRNKELTLTKDSIVENVNAYGFWASLLNYTGLIRKEGSKIYKGNLHPELTNAILEDDFLQHFDIEERYNLRM
ncbi:hypothetical protein [Evansella cellulosilytica]|uniref:Uncharacterized protein n=1 Tax=Evansella cellulosilytica (strain ATCC 21833 / DSM 2522 / FERM P-1141 / JCM 9156 / N-4) TaxID=649639 RepID=E6TR15_EVAC2|nr:hypothetical protein [Evansella cellulosilytica]ADU29391.1 hypothetical protein Bcell_1122 [Evansella cellulosilytica DSM 2522]